MPDFIVVILATNEAVALETGEIRNRAEAYHALGIDGSDGPEPGFRPTAQDD
jgi:predicted transcriptional regulator